MAKNGNSKVSGKNTLPLLNASVEPLENAVCVNFLKELTDKYDYQNDQIAVNQKSDKFENGLGWAKADIVVWKTAEEKDNKASPLIIVQGKFHDDLRLEDYFEGISFFHQSKAKIFVTLCEDQEKTNFYKFDTDKNTNKKEFITIESLPNAHEKNLEQILDLDKEFKKEAFNKLLRRCHNVIRNNDKFSPEMAFDEISKVLFAKIWYEREKGKLLTERDLRNEQSDFYEEPFYQVFFKRTKKAFEKDDIFEESDRFRIREESFYQLISILEEHKLSEILDDVKGLAFEEFLGTTFRGELGQFFTPRTVVDFMADIIDPQETELIADPCCGSGGFLIKSFDLVKDAITNEIKEVKLRFRQEVIDKNFPKLTAEEQTKRLFELTTIFADLNLELKPKSNIEFDKTDKESRLYKLSNNCIFGTDAEPRSARTAKMNMIMRGDGHSGVHHHDGLLHVNGMLRENFNVILTNPPFGARISRELLVSESDTRRNEEKQKLYVERYGQKYIEERDFLKQNQNAPVLELFDTGKEFIYEEEKVDGTIQLIKKSNPIKSTLTEVVFMERCLDLLKKGGRMGVVLPEGFLNTMDLQNAREYFEGRAKLVLIASIPQDVFIAAGATVKPSLIFLKKFTEAEEIDYNRIKTEVTAEVNAKYQPQLDEIEADYEKLKKEVDSTNQQLKKLKANLAKAKHKTKLQTAIEVNTEQLKTDKDNLRKGKKAYETKKADIENRKKREIVQGIKDLFDYEIPIVQANDAGVTSTGSASGKSDFPAIEAEHKLYRQMRAEADDPLWLSEKIEYEYNLENFVLQRRLKSKVEETKLLKKKKFKFSGEAELTEV